MSEYAPKLTPKRKCEDGDWGPDVSIGNTGRAVADSGVFSCVTDTVDGGPPLAYGDRLVYGSIVCTSLQAGLQCSNASRHGFFLSKTKAYTF